MFAASKTSTASSGYLIQRSLRFNSADSTNLSKTWSANGSRTTATISFWFKKSSVSAESRLIAFDTSGSGTIFWLLFDSSDKLQIYVSGTAVGLLTTQVFRDPSAWYHIVVGIDTTQATGTDRIKLYVNGLQITAFTGTQTYYSQNATVQFNNTAYAGLIGYNNSAAPSGYMAEVNWIDGQALTPSSFGETNAQTGVWQPKAYSGSYGTNGFYLNFSDNSNTTAATLGKDYSGNGNNWTPNNFSVTAGAGNDSLVDSPTSYGTDTGVGGTVRGNYATLNPLVFTNGYATLSNGNLDVVPDSTHYPMVPATFGMSSGKWYWEYTLGASGNGGRLLGIATSAASNTTYLGGTSSGWGYYGGNGDKYTNNSGSAYGSSYTNGDVIGVAFDADAGTLVFYKNGTSQGTAFSSLTSGPYFPAWSAGDAGQTGTTSLNFGQRPFAYTAPSGFKALCTQNLPTPTIGATTATLATKYFNPVLYNGNGGTLSVTGVGFQPDLVWLKVRNYAFVNGLFDAVRGGGKLLISNLTLAELTNDPNGYVSSFNSDGFTLTPGSTNNDTFNGSLNQMVSWNWKANGSGSTNTAGTITSTVSANTTSGFSVVTWTGNGADASIGHGLGVAPSMVIHKFRSAVSNWSVYTSTTGAGKRLKLNSTDAVVTDGSFPTTPTSSVFYINGGSNDNGVTMVAYCFAEVAGYSKFGSYTGNGSTDGPFVYTGFRPAFVLFKRTDATSDWWMYDTTRSPSNVIDIILWPNYADAEGTGASIAIDILSNGFKPRSNNATFNGSGGTYIFMAFASAPQKFALAR